METALKHLSFIVERPPNAEMLVALQSIFTAGTRFSAKVLSYSADCAVANKILAPYNIDVWKRHTAHTVRQSPWSKEK